MEIQTAPHFESDLRQCREVKTKECIVKELISSMR